MSELRGIYGGNEDAVSREIVDAIIADVLTPAVELLAEAARQQNPEFMREQLVDLRHCLNAIEGLVSPD